jgi:hypothetical protein
MNIAQLSEQLKDVPQGTLINYARDPNSVVPQFLALAEIQRRQHLQSAPQPPASTVAVDVLNEAAPQPQAPQVPQGIPQGIPQALPQQMPPQMALPENQPGVVQLPTGMPQGMAGGGIVAFADGGEAEDEDADEEDIQDARDQKKMMAMLERIRASTGNAIAGIPRDEASTRISSSEKSSSSFSVNPEDKGEVNKGITYKEPLPSGGAGGIKDVAFLNKIRHLESRGRDYDERGNILTSSKGAMGSMQTMPNTLRDPGFGVIPAQNNSVEEMNRVGRDYGNAMLQRYGNEKEAAMAYNWGPGNVDRWIASGRKGPIPGETRQYASNFNHGGIARLAIGGTLDDYATTQDTEDMEASPAFDSRFANYYAGQDAEDMAGNFINPYAGTSSTSSSKPQNAYDIMMARQAKDREELKAGAAQDAALAIMQAGFGIMGGTSPYLMANLGKGAEQGISTYGALKKARSADLSALDKAELKTLSAKEWADMKNFDIESANQRAKSTVEERKRAAVEALDRKKAEDIVKQEQFAQKRVDIAKDDYKQYMTMLEASIKSRFPLGEMDPKYAKARADVFATDPRLKQLEMQAFPNLANAIPVAPVTGLPPTVTKEGKTYVLQPNGKYIEK